MLKPRLRRRRTSSGSRRRTARRRIALVVSPAQLEARGQAGDELGQLVVEKRRARLERGQHRRAVDLGQQVVLQVHREVGVEQLGQPVGKSRPASRARAEPNGSSSPQRLEDSRRPGPPRCRSGGRLPNQMWWRSTRSISAPAGKRLEQVVEADVAHAHRSERPRRRAPGRARSARGQPPVAARRPVTDVGRIAGEQLVGALAGEDDLDLAAGRSGPADGSEWSRRRPAARRSPSPTQRSPSSRSVSAQDQLVVVGVEELRRVAGRSAPRRTPGSSWPSAKTGTPAPFCSARWASTVDESIPPDRKTPTGTSLRRRRSTARPIRSSSSSAICVRARRSVAGRRSSPPGPSSGGR